MIITRRSGQMFKIKMNIEDVEKAKLLAPWGVIRGRMGVYYVARTQPTKKLLFLHRHLMETPANLKCDILNGDNFDLRKCNLKNVEHWRIMKTNKNRVGSIDERFITKQYRNRYSKYRVDVPKDGEYVHVGAFISLPLAIAARDAFLRDGTRPPRRVASTGEKNIYKFQGRFLVRSEHFYLGYFDELEPAILARDAYHRDGITPAKNLSAKYSGKKK